MWKAFFWVRVLFFDDLFAYRSFGVVAFCLFCLYFYDWQETAQTLEERQIGQSLRYVVFGRVGRGVGFSAIVVPRLALVGRGHLSVAVRLSVVCALCSLA